MRRLRSLIGPQGMGGMVALWGASSLIKSVQTGTITIAAAGTSNTTTITTVIPDNSVVIFGGCTPTGNDIPNAAFCRVDLTNATTVTASRAVASGNGNDVIYTVVEYWPGVLRSVQRSTIVVTTTATITAVNTAKAYVSSLGFTTTQATSVDAEHFQLPRVVLTNSTTVTGTAGAVNATIGFEVVEFF